MSHLAMQDKSWFSRTLDLMIRLNSGAFISQTDFVNETTLLTRQIHQLAIEKFSVDLHTMEGLLQNAFQTIEQVPARMKAKALIQSELFQLIVCSKTPSLSPEDSQFYAENIVIRQLQDFAETCSETREDFQKTVEDLQNEPDFIKWMTDVNETLLTPEERKGIRVSISNIPLDYNSGVQEARLAGCRRITSIKVCGEVLNLLKNKLCLSASQESQEIYKHFCKHVINPAPVSFRKHVLANLIINLEIYLRALEAVFKT